MGEDLDGASVDLFWLPLGAGGHVVRWNGRVYEWWSARRDHRARADLYHCALVLRLAGITYAVEMGPVWNVPDTDRGVLVQGPVGSRWLSRCRLFRYEVRCWPGGRIPDIAEAVDSPLRTTEDPERVAALLEVLREIPALTWGRDELGAGEMWNSNSVVAWALARTGHGMDAILPPRGGRAPGWGSGVVLADAQAAGTSRGDRTNAGELQTRRLPDPSRSRSTPREATDCSRRADR